MKKKINVSEKLFNALHKQPEVFDINFDIDGYTDLDTLVSKLDEKGVKMSLNSIKRAINESDKKQFNSNKEGSKIRINPLIDINSNERR